MKRKLQYLVLSAVLGSLLVACFLLPGDTSLQTLQPCAPPCWHNIVPGQSTAADVRRILPSLPFIRTETIEDQDSYFRWLYTNPPGPFGTIKLENGVVTRIQARPGFRLELREVIERFGPPERVYPNNVRAPDGGFYQVSVYYPDKGLAFYTSKFPELGTGAGPGVPIGSTVYGTEKYSIEPDFPIEAVYYVVPTTLGEIMYLLNAGPDPRLGEFAVQHSYPWQGYGTFSVNVTPAH